MTKIEWADLTINPIVGCAKCSPGCDNCYAEKMAMRLAGHAGKLGERYQDVVHIFPEHGKGWNGSTNVDFSCFWNLPGKPARVFAGSMGDVFHASVSQDAINTLFHQIASWPQHTFMLLTKRPKRAKMMISRVPHKGAPWPVKNVWLGVTVCNQAEADEKIPLLLSTPAAKRFVSMEPMLGQIEMVHFLGGRTYRCPCGWHETERDLFLVGEQAQCNECGKLAKIFPALDWVICGGETGPGARPMNPDWARSLRDQCRAAGVPFFFKKVSGKIETPEDLRVQEAPE